MTPQEFREFGKELYGPSWRGELARSLGVSERTVLRWQTGRIPQEAAYDMAQLCRQRAARLKSIAAEIERAERKEQDDGHRQVKVATRAVERRAR